ncbi:mfs monocarboxylate transporter [Moniliophthora roreri]|nr:mfs monocarboxylate transporter [Moniliophthora roreri]
MAFTTHQVLTLMCCQTLFIKSTGEHTKDNQLHEPY